MSDLNNERRFCLLKRLSAKEIGDYAIAAVWKSKQDAQPGTALPATFPALSRLTAIGYTTQQDLDGADVDELSEYVGLSQREAEAVLAAFAAL